MKEMKEKMEEKTKMGEKGKEKMGEREEKKTFVIN